MFVLTAKVSKTKIALVVTAVIAVIVLAVILRGKTKKAKSSLRPIPMRAA